MVPNVDGTRAILCQPVWAARCSHVCPLVVIVLPSTSVFSVSGLYRVEGPRQTTRHGGVRLSNHPSSCQHATQAAICLKWLSIVFLHLQPKKKKINCDILWLSNSKTVVLDLPVILLHIWADTSRKNACKFRIVCKWDNSILYLYLRCAVLLCNSHHAYLNQLWKKFLTFFCFVFLISVDLSCSSSGILWVCEGEAWERF